MSGSGKVRNAMWELWEDRVVALRNKNTELRGQVLQLQASNNRHLEARRAAERDADVLSIMVENLLRFMEGGDKIGGATGADINGATHTTEGGTS
jgi:hypothetical protein